MVRLNLAVFERERLRIAPDEAVARLRRLAREGAPPGSPGHLGGDSCTESRGVEDGKVNRVPPSPGGLSDPRSGRDASGVLLITEAEAAALEALNGKQKGFCEREGSRLTLAMHCGLILLPGSGGGRRRGAHTEGAATYHAEGATLEILPKIWGAIEREGSDATSLLDASEKQARQALTRARRALLRLLQASDELPVFPIEAAPQATDEAPLLDLFIRSFLREVLRVAKGGLLTRYIEITDEQPVIRGRLHHAESERLARARPGLWSCTHDDLSADNPYNQALLAAIERAPTRAGARLSDSGLKPGLVLTAFPCCALLPKPSIGSSSGEKVSVTVRHCAGLACYSRCSRPRLLVGQRRLRRCSSTCKRSSSTGWPVTSEPRPLRGLSSL